MGALAKLPSREFTTRTRYTADGQTEQVLLPAISQQVGGIESKVLGAERVTTYYDSASTPRWMAGGFGWGTYVADSRTSVYGEPLAMDLGNTYGTVASYRYDAVTRRVARISLDREQVDGTDLSLQYAYDDAGNVISAKDRPTASSGQLDRQDNQCFEYDDWQRLIEAWSASSASSCTAPITSESVGGASPYWQEYTYDELGNRTSVVQHDTTSNGRTKIDYEYAGASSHRLTRIESSRNGATSTTGTFSYDDAGNVTQRSVSGTPSKALDWDATGRLSAITKVNRTDALEAGEASFVYDGSGQRLTRTNDEGTTVYLPGGQEFLVKTTGEVQPTRYYSFAGQTVAVRTGRGLEGVTSLVADAHGTVLVAVANTQRAGEVARVYSDPFGAGRQAGTAELVPGDRGFLGKTRDDGSGLTLLGARYYDEVTGRFVSVDPLLDPGVPAQFNAYVYSANNPMTWSDPSGLFWGLGDAWNAVKGVASATVDFVDRYQGEIVGGIAGVVTFSGCMAGSWGVGSVGCAAAAGAVGGAVTNLWKSQVQHTQEFSVASFATDTVMGAASGVLGLGAGTVASEFVAPAVKAAGAAVSSAVRTAAPRAAAAASSAGRAAGKAAAAVRSVPRRVTSGAGQTRDGAGAASRGAAEAEASIVVTERTAAQALKPSEAVPRWDEFLGKGRLLIFTRERGYPTRTGSSPRMVCEAFGSGRMRCGVRRPDSTITRRPGVLTPARTRGSSTTSWCGFPFRRGRGDAAGCCAVSGGQPAFR
ncbi:RHS repeat-associated core domain-containing protein [Cellulomonas sp. DKR-3]|uniref:RHS repeat-associated core domain-containing protein n=1 Tax=Cellulomonas fulva TaxID=2835530 RepID=A0ABS5U233_9CELL|nr:RHS repeat-associated core domain-containing protein [Cellulomonas fulva]MBT0995412.1 RHS repeat-associated core domain-containing protein [Cellulomonas fulva]